jgi:hypothetical protein
MNEHVIDVLKKVLQSLEQIQVSGMGAIKMAESIIMLNDLGNELVALDEEDNKDNAECTKK